MKRRKNEAIKKELKEGIKTNKREEMKNGRTRQQNPKLLSPVHYASFSAPTRA